MQFPKKPSQVKTHKFFKKKVDLCKSSKLFLYKKTQPIRHSHTHKQFALNLILPAEQRKNKKEIFTHHI